MLKRVDAPVCAKCQIPMDMASTQIVAGDRSVKVFECPKCGRLSAVDPEATPEAESHAA